MHFTQKQLLKVDQKINLFKRQHDFELNMNILKSIPGSYKYQRPRV